MNRFQSPFLIFLAVFLSIYGVLWLLIIVAALTLDYFGINPTGQRTWLGNPL